MNDWVAFEQDSASGGTPGMGINTLIGVSNVSPLGPYFPGVEHFFPDLGPTEVTLWAAGIGMDSPPDAVVGRQSDDVVVDALGRTAMFTFDPDAPTASGAEVDGTNHFNVSVDELPQNEWILAVNFGDSPGASFTWEPDPAEGSSPLEVVFTDTSIGSPTSWLWEKSDDGGSTWVPFDGTPTAQNPTENFDVGTWSVRLTATNAGGSDTHTEDDIVLVALAPVADFSGTPLSGDAPLSVTFTDLSTNTPTSWHWEKSDDSGSTWVDFDGTPTAQNPVEDFDAGTWSIRLTATNVAGSDAETKIDYIEVTSFMVAEGGDDFNVWDGYAVHSFLVNNGDLDVISAGVAEVLAVPGGGGGGYTNNGQRPGGGGGGGGVVAHDAAYAFSVGAHAVVLGAGGDWAGGGGSGDGGNTTLDSTGLVAQGGKGGAPSTSTAGTTGNSGVTGGGSSGNNAGAAGSPGGDGGAGTTYNIANQSGGGGGGSGDGPDGAAGSTTQGGDGGDSVTTYNTRGTGFIEYGGGGGGGTYDSGGTFVPGVGGVGGGGSGYVSGAVTAAARTGEIGAGHSGGGGGGSASSFGDGGAGSIGAKGALFVRYLTDLVPVYATLTDSGATLSNGNMTATKIDAYASARADKACFSGRTGKFYFELYLDFLQSVSVSGPIYFGIVSAAGYNNAANPVSQSGYAFMRTNGGRYTSNNHASFFDGTNPGGAGAVVTGDRMCLAFDTDDWKLYAGKISGGVRTWFNSANIAAGTGYIAYGRPQPSAFYLAIGFDNANPTPGSTCTLISDIADYEFSPPTGYRVGIQKYPL